ncbi:MAG: hypothetical protein AB7O62_25300 [Pirellulales bacterium]
MQPSSTSRPLPPLPWGSLPARMRVLHVAAPARGTEWLSEAFAADSATLVTLESVAGSTAAMLLLHEQSYDAVLVRHEPKPLDAPEFVAALRAGGGDMPVVVLGDDAAIDIEAACYEAGADAYLCLATTATRSLIWTLARAAERHALLRENRRLRQFEQRRLKAEHAEADRLLAQQRWLIRDLESLRGEAAVEEVPLLAGEAGIDLADDAAEVQIGLTCEIDAGVPPAYFVTQYREMLRAYVMMGSGRLTAELAALADSLVADEVSAASSVQWHMQAVEEMVRGLGQRSSRHVLNRADALILELMTHLVEGYRRHIPNRDSNASRPAA